MDEAWTGGAGGGRRAWAAGLVGSGLVVAVLCVPVAAPAAAGTCADVEVVVVRGTGETSGVGTVMRPVADAVAGAVAGTSSVHGLPYPATSSFSTSSSEGRRLLVEHLRARALECPDQRYVLIGYSQGAMVVGDALAGPAPSPLPEEAGGRIAAVLLFGNPRRTPGEPFDVGTAGRAARGVYPRAAGALEDYASRLRDECAAGDPFCAGGTNMAAHIGYAASASAAASFVDRHLRGGSDRDRDRSGGAGGEAADPVPSPAPRRTTSTRSPLDLAWIVPWVDLLLGGWQASARR